MPVPKRLSDQVKVHSTAEQPAEALRPKMGRQPDVALAVVSRPAFAAESVMALRRAQVCSNPMAYQHWCWKYRRKTLRLLCLVLSHRYLVAAMEQHCCAHCRG
mmetsp:Transcript_113133/g.314962  ORF Transcript_113133/g.314962 Transcript_113133/m.314962 type:complete len:103 (-) Transcript_113133:552-860(-)